LASLKDGRVIQRFDAPAAAATSIAPSPDGRSLFYGANGSIWSQPISGGAPRRVTDGTDVVFDRGGFLYVKRTRRGSINLFRVPPNGGEGEQIELSNAYHLADVMFSPMSVDKAGRVLITVLSAHSFYYRPAVFDPANHALTVVPIAYDGDVSEPGWTPDGRIAAYASRYVSSLWRYRPKLD
jgi:hypothetical protein